MARFVALDLETTGLDPECEDVFEVAAINLADGEEFVARLEPRRSVLMEMHPKAAEVNRYYERTADPSWSWDSPHWAADRLARLLHGAFIVGAIPDFDTRHLREFYRRLELPCPQWKYRLRCVESMVMGRFGLEELGGLQHAAALMGVGVPEGWAHTALGDARTVVEVWRRLVSTFDPEPLPEGPAREVVTAAGTLAEAFPELAPQLGRLADLAVRVGGGRDG